MRRESAPQLGGIAELAVLAVPDDETVEVSQPGLVGRNHQLLAVQELDLHPIVAAGRPVRRAAPFGDDAFELQVVQRANHIIESAGEAFRKVHPGFGDHLGELALPGFERVRAQVASLAVQQIEGVVHDRQREARSMLQRLE